MVHKIRLLNLKIQWHPLKIISYNTIIWRKNILILRMCASFKILSILHEKNIYMKWIFLLIWVMNKIKHNTCAHTPSLLPQLYRSKFSLNLSICNQGKLIHILNIFIPKLEHTSHYNPINNSRPISCKQFNVTFLFPPVWSLPL